MGKFKRIPVKDIRAMQKTLDELPDKNLGKTREEAVAILNANILKALEKGYSVKELSAIMAKGNVSIPPPIIRATALPPKPAVKRGAKPKADASKAAVPQIDRATARQPQPEPAYYTPDILDTEL